MKKIMVPFLGMLAVLGTSNFAKAEALTCSVEYNVEGGGLQVVLGYFKLQGKGTIHCLDSKGAALERDVLVTLGGHPVEPLVGAGYFHLWGAAVGVGLNGSIEDLYGHYLMVDAGATVGLGVNASISVENPKNGYRMNFGIAGTRGLGVEAGFSVLTIEPAADQEFLGGFNQQQTFVQSSPSVQQDTAQSDAAQQYFVNK